MNVERNAIATDGVFGNVLWVMFAALMFMAIWIVITVFADLSRRSDIGDVARCVVDP